MGEAREMRARSVRKTHARGLNEGNRKGVDSGMKAIIPAAGIGTRLRPHTLTIPKALLMVAGRPILGHIVDSLSDAGIEDFVVVVGYHGERIREYIARDHGDKKFVFVEQDDRLGLGHAVFTCREAVRSGPMMAILGDTIVKAGIPSIVRSPDNVIATWTDVPEPMTMILLASGAVALLRRRR